MLRDASFALSFVSLFCRLARSVSCYFQILQYPLHFFHLCDVIVNRFSLKASRTIYILVMWFSVYNSDSIALKGRSIDSYLRNKRVVGC